MHDAIVRLKNGETLEGPIWTWRPKYGWFSLVDSPPIALDDVESITTKVIRSHIEGKDFLVEQDPFARALAEGWIPGSCPDGNLILADSGSKVRLILGDPDIYKTEPPALDHPGYIARKEWSRPWEPGELCFYRGPLDSGYYSCRFRRESKKGLHLWIEHRVEPEPEELAAFGMR